MKTILSAETEAWPIRNAFTLSRGSKTEAVVVVCRIARDGFTGFGECVPYARYGESVDSVLAQIEAAKPLVGDGGDREQLRQSMPPGAARNAVDCALWDLAAKQAHKRVWQVAGLPAPGPLRGGQRSSSLIAHRMRYMPRQRQQAR